MEPSEISPTEAAGMRASLTAQVAEAMREGRTPEPEQVEALAAIAPYFTAPAAALLSDPDSVTDAGQRRRLEALVALGSSDPAAAFTLTDPEGELFADFYPAEDEAERTPTTDSAIDTFLSAYGNMDTREAALLERLIFNPVADYSQVLAREAQAEREAAQQNPESVASPGGEADETPLSDEASRQDRLLDSFLTKYAPGGESGATEPHEPEPQPKPEHPRRASAATRPAAGSLLSESLAAIYVRRGRFDKAYEIIRNISLNYPEKSVYFADQLRFLQKLMLNARAGKQNPDRADEN